MHLQVAKGDCDDSPGFKRDCDEYCDSQKVDCDDTMAHVSDREDRAGHKSDCNNTANCTSNCKDHVVVSNRDDTLQDEAKQQCHFPVYKVCQ